MFLILVQNLVYTTHREGTFLSDLRFEKKKRVVFINVLLDATNWRVGIYIANDLNTFVMLAKAISTNKIHTKSKETISRCKKFV